MALDIVYRHVNYDIRWASPAAWTATGLRHAQNITWYEVALWRRMKIRRIGKELGALYP